MDTSTATEAAAASAAPPEPRHAMVDLETLGKRPFCPIMSIGACAFHMDPTVDNEKAIADVFKANVTLQSCLDVGLRIAAETLAWWMGADPKWSPNEAARRDAFLNEGAVALPAALDAFTGWLNSRPLQLWGNSARFDLGILESAYIACGKNAPWSFRDERCYRTIKCLPGAREVECVRFGTYHNPLDDAITQALHLRAINQKLQLQL